MSIILFQFLWRPYTRQEVSRLIVVDIPPVSRATVPIICFATVEIHQADRVMRQFGLRQNIPPKPVNLDQVHRDDLRGRNDRDWVAHHHQWITIWNDRENRIVQGTPFSGNGHLRDETPYMQWYINHTIRYISPSTESSDDEVIYTTMLYIYLPYKLIHNNNHVIYFTVRYVTTTFPACFTTLHWPCWVFSRFHTSSPILFRTVAYGSGSNVWTVTSSIWQPIKHLIPTRPFSIWFLPASVKLWCWSITYVWHHNHDTIICLLSRIFIINASLSSANALPITTNSAKCPKSSR